MITDTPETNEWTVARLLEVYHHPELADMYKEAIELLHSLEYTVIDDHLNALVSSDEFADGTVVISNIADIFITCLHAGIREHGILLSDDCTAEELFIFLHHLVVIGNYEDKGRLLSILDSNDDLMETLVSLFEEVGDSNAFMYFDKVTYVADPFLTNLRAYLNESYEELQPIAENPSIIFAKKRLESVPPEIKERSIMYKMLEDGFSLGYDLDVDTHATLVSVLEQCISPRYMVDEVRIFLLASNVYGENLRKVFNHVVETLLPDEALSAILTIREVGYDA